MASEEEILAKIAILNKRDEIAREKNKELSKDLKLPLHLLVQVKKADGMLKYPEKAKRLEKTQEGVFERVIKNRHPQLKKEWKDMFAEFYTEYLKGKVRSINDFLYKDRLGRFDDDNLKDIFKV